MSETVRFQEVLRRLALVDETFVTGQAGLGLGPAGTVALDGRTAALLQFALSVALGSSRACLEWGTARPLAAGATDDEIADVLLVIAPVAGLGRVVCAAPDVATALGYDVAAGVEEAGDHCPVSFVFTGCSAASAENPDFHADRMMRASSGWRWVVLRGEGPPC